LISEIKKQIRNKLQNHDGVLISRLRYRESLVECVNHLSFVIDNQVSDIELKAETLRHASDCIGRITGKIDVEDLLDVIFSEFCVGK
jgi:tRNA modification GTPase